MQWLLIAMFIAGLGYFLLRRRALDAFTIAFFSAGIYFLPGFVGYTLSPVTPASPLKLPVAMTSEAIAIMAAVLATITVAAAVWDWSRLRLAPPQWQLEECSRAADVALALGVVGVALTWIETSGGAFAADKRVVIAVVGRGHILWEMGASLAAVLAFANRKWLTLTAAAGLLALDMFIGFRFAFALSFVACAWLWLGAGQPVRLRELPARYWAAVLAGGLLIISYQNLKEPIRQGNWTEVGGRISDPLWYAKGVMTSEPFTTQTVLNEVVRRDFRTQPEHLWSATHHLIVFAPALGGEAVRFNDLYQPALFPLVDHGLANNIWAQMWSAGGWLLLASFLLAYVTVLAIGSQVLASRDPTIRGGAALFMAYWAFYIHRNELLVQAGFQKQVLLIWAACVVVAILVSRAARPRPGRREASSAG